MHPEQQLKWLFLDLNSYFASVEQQDNEDLRGKPVAVVPMETDYTCAIAASYEAKKFGIKTGTRILEAKQLCPGLYCVLARHDAYVRYHHLILAEVDKHTPVDKVCSVDELASRLPYGMQSRDAAAALATRIREGIWKNVGQVINCSIGVAQNSLLAKIATDMQKPNGLIILEPKEIPRALFDLKLTDLPGINVKMEERLNGAGVTSIEQFCQLAPKHVRKIWGSVVGERFWYGLHGYDIPDQETSRTSIGHSRVLDPQLRQPDSACQVARRLTIKAASRLRLQDLYATRFYLSVRDGDDQRWEGEARLSPSQDNFSFVSACDELWNAMMQSLRPRKLKKVAVTLYGFCRREEITPDLFDTASPAYQNVWPAPGLQVD
jgi:DNA polymerase-4